MFINKGGRMKTIAISVAKKSLEARVEGLFGRARLFILADPATLEWEALDNLPNLSSNQLIGIMTAQSLIRKNIKTVMTGKCGPKAFKELKSAGIEVFLETNGTVRQALERLMRGEVNPATGPNVSEAR
jgi:predicted Fe-Mo cluster-binding NifX family protein